MDGLPSGTVTFLFTDLESSTRLWEQHPEEMKAALARHDTILREAVEARGGYVVKSTGDGLHAVFATADAAVAAAVSGQLALAAESWAPVGGLRVRMGLHTGAAEERGGDYYGTAVNRAARLMGVAHAGQILCAQATADLVRDSLPAPVALKELGNHRLRDLTRPEVVFQVTHPELVHEFPPLTSLDAFPGNLPVQRNPLVGRARELARLREMSDANRLTTLTGVGGVGKTRLALQLAAETLDRFPDGAWLVALAPIRDPALVPSAVATALGVAERPGQAVTDTVCDAVGTRELLVVLDNCEHLLDATARLVDELLDRCPGIRIVATSREALGVEGEQSWPTPSLGLPSVDSTLGVAAFARSDAVALFVERARAVHPDFELSESNAGAVVGLCERLDGIPLAIELAAARVSALGPQDLLERIDQRFLLLTGGSRTALERHQTLQAAVDWSYELLTEADRRLFEQLSVFAGSFTLEAARAVAGDAAMTEVEVLDRVGSLVAKSMLVADRSGSSVRYRLLETLRQYGRDRLAATDDARATRDRHARYYRDFIETMEPLFFSSGQAIAMDLLQSELDNLRAAFDWLLETGNASDALVVMHMGGMWNGTNEAMRHAEALLSALDSLTPSEQVEALGMGAWQAFNAGAHARATELAEASMARADDIGIEPPWFAYSTIGLAAFWRNDGTRACEALEHGVAIARAGLTDELRSSSSLIGSLANLCFVRGQLGQTDDAIAAGDEALALARELGAPTLLNSVLWQLGLALQSKDPRRAAALLDESVELAALSGRAEFTRGWTFVATGQIRGTLGDHTGAVAAFAEAAAVSRRTGERFYLPIALQGMARAMRQLDQLDEAARLLGAAQNLSEQLGLPGGPVDIAARDRAVARLRELLGEEGFDAAWSAGQALSFDGAVALALEVASRHASTAA